MKTYFKGIQILLFTAFAFCLTMTVSFVARAADFPVPEGDIASILLNLATNYKTLGLLGMLSGLTIISVQAIKALVPDEFKYKRLLTLVISMVYSTVSGLIVPGSNLGSVIMTVLLTSGGAMALYEALKGAKVITP